MKQWLFMFCLGLRDSLSLSWLRKILFLTHPLNKNIHPSSLKLLATLKNTFVQVFVFLIGLPGICRWLGQDFLGQSLSIFFLILTYGYLFFYNTDVITTTKQVALWSSKFPNSHFCEPDHREKTELFYSLSNQIKSFIFLLLYYTPIFISCLLLSLYWPVLGTFCLLTSEAFFNSSFYFLKKWPYDKYNIGFIEKNMAYMLGYGMFVSFVCNIVLSGDLARGAYFLISQWMIINCILFSPPEKDFQSWDEFKGYLWGEKRASLPNGYNAYRSRIRKEKRYRSQMIKEVWLLKPALIITEVINEKLAEKMQGGLRADSITEVEEAEEDEK